MEISRDEIDAMKKMSVSQRIILVEEIWDSIATGDTFPDLTNRQQDELKKRIDAYHAAPSEGRIWEEIKAELGAEER